MAFLYIVLTPCLVAIGANGIIDTTGTTMPDYARGVTTAMVWFAWLIWLMNCFEMKD